MQTKKDELKESIYNIARKEFLMKGYTASSMRTIARKANTSIGNIYHYYPSKEALLDEMMQKALQGAATLIHNHFEAKQQIHSLQELEKELADLDSNNNVVSAVLTYEFAIFVKLEDPYYQKERTWLMQSFAAHMAWHLGNADPGDHFITLITNMFVESVVFVVKSHEQKEQAMADFKRLFKMICSGVITMK